MKGGKPCLPGGSSLAQFVLDAGAELDPKRRGVNRGQIDVDIQGAQTLGIIDVSDKHEVMC